MKVPMWEITITVDTNDGDYNTVIRDIKPERLELIMPLLKAIKKNNGNYPNSEYNDESARDIYSDFDVKVLDSFEDLCPYGENGFHSVESVEITPARKKKRLV